MSVIIELAWGVGKHLAFGYLVYSLLNRKRRRTPNGTGTVVISSGIMFPDIMDKSLVFLGILEYGRSFAHSLFTTSLLIATVYVVTNRLDQGDSGRAFGLGYVLHLPVDLYGPMLSGNNQIDTAFLFWPIAVDRSLGLTSPPVPFAKHTVFSIVIISAVALWILDGFPVASDIAHRLSLRPHD